MGVCAAAVVFEMVICERALPGLETGEGGSGEPPLLVEFNRIWHSPPNANRNTTHNGTDDKRKIPNLSLSLSLSLIVPFECGKPASNRGRDGGVTSTHR